MKRDEELTQLRLQLGYDPVSGVFVWKHEKRLASGALRIAAGDRAGTSVGKGYRQIQVKINGKKRGFKEHRLAWLFVHGRWPNGQIDHINGNTSDNRIVNLREATNSQNMMNRKLNANSQSGAKGVSFHQGSQRWRARLQLNGKRIHLGDFKNKEAAEIAYEAAAKRHFGEFARLK